MNSDESSPKLAAFYKDIQIVKTSFQAKSFRDFNQS